MKYIEFWQETYPEDYKKSYEESLFNSIAHLKLQASEGWQHFYVVNHAKRSVMAQFSCHIDENVANSPFKSPFGAVEFDEQLPLSDLYKFIGFIEDCLGNEGGVDILKITCYPQYYHHANFVKLTNALLNLGFQAVKSELSTGLVINESPFGARVYPSEKGRLQKCEQRGFTFQQEPLENFEEVYHLIQGCYLERGYHLSMGYEGLQQTVDTFQDAFKLFSIRNELGMISGSVAIQINSKVLYNFYSGHIKAYDSFSPAVMLMGGLYGYCQKEQLHLLDMGTSSIEGMPNFNLLRFKRQVGGEFSLKLTFQKVIA